MFHKFCHGIDICRHDLKGVYVYLIKKTRNPFADPKQKVLCTLHEGAKEDSDMEDSPAEADDKPGPISITYQGVCTMLRPWDPYTCIIAAAIRNCLIHFPIQPGSCIFALGFSLETLSHIADIVHSKGRVIGVIDKDSPQNPPPDKLQKFLRSNPGASIIVDKIQVASFDHYERLLSLPKSSKYAFLSGLHPRLGMKSPVLKLKEAPEPSKLAQHIFDFLVCNDAAGVQCLVVRCWSAEMQIDVIRETVLSHIDALQHWKAAVGTTKQEDPVCVSDKEEAKGEVSSDGQDGGTKKKSKDERQFWVLMEFRTDCVVKDMSRLPTGVKTGLIAKEQLSLVPYFSDHALLLMKYDARYDDRHRKTPKHKRSLAPVTEEINEESSATAPAEGAAAAATAQTSSKFHPPAMGAMPVPSFAMKSEGRPKNPGLALAIEAAPKIPMPAVAAPREERKARIADDSGSANYVLPVGSSACAGPPELPTGPGSCPPPPGLMPPPGMQHGLRAVGPHQGAAAQGGVLRAPRWKGPGGAAGSPPTGMQTGFHQGPWGQQPGFAPGVRGGLRHDGGGGVNFGGGGNPRGPHSQAAFSLELGLGGQELLYGGPGEDMGLGGGVPGCDQLWPSRPSHPLPGYRDDDDQLGAGRRPPPVYAPYGKGNAFNGKGFGGGMSGVGVWPQGRPPDQPQYGGQPTNAPAVPQLDQFQHLRMSF